MKIGRLVALLMAVSVTAGLGSAQLADKKVLTLAVAKQIAAAAEAQAAKDKLRIVIAIVDDGNNLMYLERMDETSLHSIEVAQGKARTALAWQHPTKMLEDAVAGGHLTVLGQPGNIAAEGGIPLTTADGKILGAIGISGGNSQQDGVIAQAGVDALAKILAH
jgi:glc operon protein GlcG